MIIIGILFRLTEQTKSNYWFLYAYSIESIDIEDQSHDNNEIQYVSIRNNVFSESNFSSFTIQNNILFQLAIMLFNIQEISEKLNLQIHHI